jgi:hypothetical protein
LTVKQVDRIGSSDVEVTTSPARRSGRPEGSGRPKVINDPVKAAFWLERSVLAKAKAEARRRGTTVSEVVRQAVSRLAGGRRKKAAPPKKSRS